MAVAFCPMVLSAAAHVEFATRFVVAAVPVHVVPIQTDIPTLFTAIWMYARDVTVPESVANVMHSSR